MSAESAASGSSTYRPGSKQKPRARDGGNLGDLLASLFGRHARPQPGNITFDPTLPPQPVPQTVAPGKGDLPQPTSAPVSAQPPIPRMRPPVQGPGLPPVDASLFSPNLGPFGPPDYNPSGPSVEDLAFVAGVNQQSRQRVRDERNAYLGGVNLANASGYYDDPYYTPVPGMGPLPYDPAENDVYFDPVLGGMRYRTPNSNFGGPK